MALLLVILCSFDDAVVGFDGVAFWEVFFFVMISMLFFWVRLLSGSTFTGWFVPDAFDLTCDVVALLALVGCCLPVNSSVFDNMSVELEDDGAGVVDEVKELFL